MTVILTLICRHDNCDIRHSKQHNEVYNNIPVSEGRKQEGGGGEKNNLNKTPARIPGKPEFPEQLDPRGIPRGDPRDREISGSKSLGRRGHEKPSP